MAQEKLEMDCNNCRYHYFDDEKCGDKCRAVYGKNWEPKIEYWEIN